MFDEDEINRIAANWKPDMKKQIKVSNSNITGLSDDLSVLLILAHGYLTERLLEELISKRIDPSQPGDKTSYNGFIEYIDTKMKVIKGCLVNIATWNFCGGTGEVTTEYMRVGDGEAGLTPKPASFNLNRYFNLDDYLKFLNTY